MVIHPLKISLEFANLEDAKAFAKSLQELDPSALTVSDLDARPISGSAGILIVLVFLAEILKDVAIGLLSSRIYDALKGERAVSSRFVVRIGETAVECASQEDLVVALKAARESISVEPKA